MSLRLTWLGHSTVVLDLDGSRLISDPLLTRHAGLLRRRGPAPDADAWRGARAALLSHLHHDHAHLPSLRLLGRVPVLTALGNARWLADHGLVTEGALAPDQWARVGPAEGGSGVRVRLTPAVHASRRMPHRPNWASGHLVTSAAATVWFAGDTELFPGLTDVARAHGRVDIAVVPVGGWGPRLSGGHLDPDDAARACGRAGARFAIPVHWGTLHPPGGRRVPPGWMDRAGDRFSQALGRHAPQCEAVVLRPGQSWTPEGTDRTAAV